MAAIEQYKYDLPGVVAQAEEALGNSLEHPRIFQRGNALVLILPAEPRPKDRIQRAEGSPTIRPCLPSTLRLCLAKAAEWYTPDKRSKSLEQTMPQPWVVDTVLDLGEWPHIPPLTGVIMAPTLRQDGTILDTPGYDPATGLFFDPGPAAFPAIPPMPTKRDAFKALRVLLKPFRNFPFAEKCHRSAALAAVFTLLLRHAIQGQVPMFGVKAPTAGTGKTLLVDTVSVIATGRPAPKLSQPSTEEEWNKQLFTCALEGDQLVLIDNCVKTVASGELCKNITAEVVKGRILGVHKNGEAPQNAVYFATGNNLRFRSDIVRRVIPINLKSPLERPETRTGFHIKEPLLAWTLAHRSALVCAALTILRAYALAQDTPTVPKLGNFEAWCSMVCAPLVWLGLPNPLDGTGDIKDEDEEREKIRELLIAWHAIYKDLPTTLKTVKQDIGLQTQPPAHPLNDYDVLLDALKAFDNSNKELLNLESVASNLKSAVDRIVCGKVLTRGKTRTRSGYPWIVTQQNVCSCAACVAISPQRARNVMTNTSSSSQSTTPATQHGGMSGVNNSGNNGLGGGSALNGSYTPATHSAASLPVEDAEDGYEEFPL